MAGLNERELLGAVFCDTTLTECRMRNLDFNGVRVVNTVMDRCQIDWSGVESQNLVKRDFQVDTSLPPRRSRQPHQHHCTRRRQLMAEFNIGEGVPWVPIERGQNVPVRGTNLDYPNLIADRTLVGDGVNNDRDLLQELRELERRLGGSGSGGGRPPVTGVDFPDDEPTTSSDHLAWYVTFRHLEDWGVYISRRGRAELAQFLVHQGAKAQQAHDASWYLLRNHETAHFLVDRAVHTLEAILRAESGRSVDLWLHRSLNLHHDDLEEAVCNSYAYRMAASHTGSPWRAIRDFISRQPSGYRDIDFDTAGNGRGASPTGMTRFQAESQLLTSYLTRTATTTQRVVGLDSLMGYRNREAGTNGDVILRVTDREKRTLPVYQVP